jgi:drug/metabolite transporter (DMT)-like permease
MRRFVSSTGMSALAFTFGYIAMAGLVMTLLTPFLVLTPVHLDVPIVVSLVLLGCLGTGIAYVWNQNTVRAWGPTRASTVTYITPVVGVILGELILGETISWNEPVGALVVFLGILLAQDRLRRRPRTGPAGAASVSASPPAGGSPR